MMNGITNVQILTAVSGVVLALGVLMLSVYWFEMSENSKAGVTVPPISITPEGESAFRDFWAAQIALMGGADAYQYFKDSYEREPQFHKHEVAHIFGGLLYAAEGRESISVCDEEYDYGCYHEFIGSAFKAEGVGILGEIDTYCKTDGLDCQHGIGHGLLAVAGYEVDGLNQALRLCRDIGTVDERDGCYGGIFMEFNMRTMWGDAYRRPLGDTPGVHLCSEVVTEAETACGFWLAQWLLAEHMVTNDLEVALRLAVDNCSQISSLLIPECYNGLGYELSGYETDIRTGLDICTNVAGDALFAQQCTMSVLAGYYGAVAMREAASEACGEQTAVDANLCQSILESMSGSRIAPLRYY